MSELRVEVGAALLERAGGLGQARDGRFDEFRFRPKAVRELAAELAHEDPQPVWTRRTSDRRPAAWSCCSPTTRTRPHVASATRWVVRARIGVSDPHALSHQVWGHDPPGRGVARRPAMRASVPRPLRPASSGCASIRAANASGLRGSGALEDRLHLGREPRHGFLTSGACRTAKAPMTSASSGLVPDDRPRVGDDRAHEPGERVAHVGYRDRDLALGGWSRPGSAVKALTAQAPWHG
jgi:hypothetical protein